MQKIIGVIPARMGSSRFPGKPLCEINGMTMLEHVWHRASMSKCLDELFIATCDKEIEDLARLKNIPCIMTSKLHERALDRVYEAVISSNLNLNDDDVILNIQGDEPMLIPDMIDLTANPMITDKDVDAVVLAMPIMEEAQYFDPNAVKIINNLKGDAIYSSRSPVPYSLKWSKDLGAKRIFGIFGFKLEYLQRFTNLEESPLEVVESCDSNRLYDNGLTQRVVVYPYTDSFSVDSPEDVLKVSLHIKSDPIWKLYNDK